MAVAQPTTPAQDLTVFNAVPGESASGPGAQLQTSAVMEPVAQPLQNAWVSNEDPSTGESLYVTTVPLPDICRMLNVPLVWVPVDEQCGLEQQAPFSSLALGTDSHSHRQPLCAKVDVDDSANELCDMATPADTAAVVVQMRPVRSIDRLPSTF
ncbi:hypothetical protein H4R35_005917 [Dimargaris xerosporica]|nr:hypothetical protein H4R35_005917 [Dimargaris xerosporica]